MELTETQAQKLIEENPEIMKKYHWKTKEEEKKYWGKKTYHTYKEGKIWKSRLITGKAWKYTYEILNEINNPKNLHPNLQQLTQRQKAIYGEKEIATQTIIAQYKDIITLAAKKYGYGIEENNINNKYVKISCPEHQDKTPSMILWKSINGYKCYSCGISGNMKQFIKLHERYKK